MKTRAFIALSILLGSPAFLHGDAQAAQRDSARAAIEAQSASFTASLAKGDATEAAQIFTVNAMLSVPGVEGVLEGRQAIEKFWQAALAGGMKSLTLTPREVDGSGDLRIETGTYAAFGANRSELGRGEYLMVWKREEGAWKIHRDYGHASGAMPVANAIAEDRVGLPRDYATAMRQVSDTVYDEKSGMTTVFANDLAASIAGFSQQHYPDGAVILMEFAQPQRDGEGELLRDARGAPIKGPIDHIDVMRRGPDFGASYGAERAGEWEFASYRSDGSVRVASANAVNCAACHRNAGADKDFVFRTRPWLPLK
ncbi:MAG TPA: cytochrome P460 family protein [Steroidobacteraceae bacterium]